MTVDRPEGSPTPGIVLEELEHEGRVRLLAYHLKVSEERTLAEVELQHAQRLALGRAEAGGAGAAPELLALACLDAIEKLLQARVSLRLAGFRHVVVGGEDIMIVVVQENDRRRERTLVGAARAAGDLGRAAAYAALDSMNRRLGRILTEPKRDYEIG